MRRRASAVEQRTAADVRQVEYLDREQTPCGNTGMKQ